MKNIKQHHPLTFCISTYNNLPYLKLAIQSVRKIVFLKMPHLSYMLKIVMMVLMNG
jgi:hypothetical protein